LQITTQRKEIPLTVLPTAGAKRRVMTLRDSTGAVLGYFPRKRFEAALAGLTVTRAAAIVDLTLKPSSWIVVEGTVNARVRSRSVIFPMTADEALKLLKQDDEKEADAKAIADAKLGKAILFQPRNIKNELLEARRAWPVVIVGFEDLSFVAHKIDSSWSVSEFSTGMRVAANTTKPKAIADAMAALQKHGLEKAKQIVVDALAKLPQERGADDDGS